MGPPAKNHLELSESNEIGLLPRVLTYLFEEIHRREAQENVHYSCFVSFMEIYNEKIKDLLNPIEQRKLNILFNAHCYVLMTCIHENNSSKDHRISVENLTIKEVSSAEEAGRFVNQGLQNRQVGVTNMNIRSSRSHAVFTLYITCEVFLCVYRHS